MLSAIFEPKYVNVCSHFRVLQLGHWYWCRECQPGVYETESLHHITREAAGP